LQSFTLHVVVIMQVSVLESEISNMYITKQWFYIMLY